jgi:hypothetical protein
MVRLLGNILDSGALPQTNTIADGAHTDIDFHRGGKDHRMHTGIRLIDGKGMSIPCIAGLIAAPGSRGR